MDPSGILKQIAISAVPILIAITFHEVAHGYIAYRLGDPTAKVMGRLTLNPIAHIDPVGTVLMPALLLIFTKGQFVFGYAKPIPINPYNFKNPKRDMAISAAGGPAANMALAVASILVLKYVVVPLSLLAPESSLRPVFEPLMLMLQASMFINVVLASFNLIPIPPLDGGRVLTGVLPYKYAVSFGKIEPYGMLIVILLIVTGASDIFVIPLIKLFLGLLNLL